MKDYGLNLNLYVTHGIFSKGFDELTRWFDHIYTTDSFFPLPEYRENDEPWDKQFTVIHAGGTILSSLLKPSDLRKNK